MLLPLLSALLATSTAIPLSKNSPVVHIKNGSVVGQSSDGFDNFWGIPYAKPPVQNLRLLPPQTIDESFGTLKLPGSLDQVAACTNMDMTAPPNLTALGIPVDQQDDFVGVASNFTGLEREDCLTINAQRPANIPSGTKLPVLFWIYGGGWEIGTTQDYDGQAIVNLSVSMGEPVIFVAANYRLNAFGFLQGKELQAEGTTNIGLRDQRKALEWVAENIEAFGGDADRVTIWGESAGSASVYDHLTINLGDNTYNGKLLFHAGIMNSGSIIFNQPADSVKAQKIFDTVATNAGCPPSSQNNGSKVLDCLRQVPYDKFKDAMNSVPNFGGVRTNDLSYIRRPDPSSNFYSQYSEDAAKTGQYAKVPLIMGNMQDESTVFTPSQAGLINGTKTLVDYIASWMTETPREIVEGLIDTYSTDPADGLPADTGSKYEIYPQSKRDAAVQTDMTFIMGRRIALSYMSKEVPTWSYLATYLQGNPWWGTYHTADLATQFGLSDNVYAGTKMDEAYIHFVNYHDPNGKAGEEWWPKWSNEGLTMANFSKSDVGLTKDDFRWESYEYWRQHGSEMRF